jgi:hypothetical protein
MLIPDAAIGYRLQPISGTFAQTQMRWMFGPYTEMISGGSGGYGFLSLCIHGPPAGISSYVPLGLLPIAVLVTRVRHYGATHLRVYLRKHDHEKYRKKLRPRGHVPRSSWHRDGLVNDFLRHIKTSRLEGLRESTGKV